MGISGKAAVEDAREFALYWHGSQKDKGGVDYEEHLKAVGDIACQLQREKRVAYCENLEDMRTAAWLHDVVEDTKQTMRDLTDRGYNSYVLKMVEALTKRTNEQQHLYLSRVIAAGRGAMLVKLADLYHNTQYNRLSKLPKHTQVRLLEKYSKAVGALESILEVSNEVRRAWALRQMLAKLKAEGYTSTAPYTSYNSGSTTLIWDKLQNKSVPPAHLIGGPEWDGFYPSAEQKGVLVRAPKGEDGKYIVPGGVLVHRKVWAAPTKGLPSTVPEWESWDGWWQDSSGYWHQALYKDGKWSNLPPSLQGKVPKRQSAPQSKCAFPTTHGAGCTCALPKVYTPSLDYKVEQKKVVTDGDVN